MSENDETEPVETKPPLFVVKGDATAEEVAALVAVLQGIAIRYQCLLTSVAAHVRGADIALRIIQQAGRATHLVNTISIHVDEERGRGRGSRSTAAESRSWVSPTRRISTTRARVPRSN